MRLMETSMGMNISTLANDLESSPQKSIFRHWSKFKIFKCLEDILILPVDQGLPSSLGVDGLFSRRECSTSSNIITNNRKDKTSSVQMERYLHKLPKIHLDHLVFVSMSCNSFIKIKCDSKDSGGISRQHNTISNKTGIHKPAKKNSEVSMVEHPKSGAADCFPLPKKQLANWCSEYKPCLYTGRNLFLV